MADVLGKEDDIGADLGILIVACLMNIGGGLSQNLENGICIAAVDVPLMSKIVTL